MRKRKSERARHPSGHREFRLRGTQTLYLWHTDDAGKRHCVALTCPADIVATRVMVSATEGIQWRIGAMPDASDLH